MNGILNPKFSCAKVSQWLLDYSACAGRGGRREAERWTFNLFLWPPPVIDLGRKGRGSRGGYSVTLRVLVLKEGEGGEGKILRACSELYILQDKR